ncbi:MAG TPA: hypothetical protein VIK57_02215, partial [Streptosporangiaceae bacterium]
AAAYAAAGHNMCMVCPSCRDQHHAECPGGTWCDCQHQPLSALPAPPPPSPRSLSWLRQG